MISPEIHLYFIKPWVLSLIIYYGGNVVKQTQCLWRKIADRQPLNSIANLWIRSPTNCKLFPIFSPRPALNLVIIVLPKPIIIDASLTRSYKVQIIELQCTNCLVKIFGQTRHNSGGWKYIWCVNFEKIRKKALFSEKRL